MYIIIYLIVTFLATSQTDNYGPGVCVWWHVFTRSLQTAEVCSTKCMSLHVHMLVKSIMGSELPLSFKESANAGCGASTYLLKQQTITQLQKPKTQHTALMLALEAARSKCIMGKRGQLCCGACCQSKWKKYEVWRSNKNHQNLALCIRGLWVWFIKWYREQ